MASVRGDDLVVLLDGALHPYGDGLLSDGEVAEPADELLLVELVGCHLHPAHLGHGLVHVDELSLRHLDLVLRDLEAVPVEGVLLEVDLCAVREALP